MHVAASVVLFHPDLTTLRLTLSALATWPHGAVLVHVNEPTSEVVASLRELLPNAITSTSDENLGFSGAHNRLLATAFAGGADAVVVHNPDLILDAGAVAALSTTSARYDGRALLGPALQLAGRAMAPEGRIDTVGIVWTASGRHLDKDQGRAWPPDSQDAAAVAGISGACLYVPRPAYQAIVDVGGEFFDEDFVAYREDAELGFRAALLGIPSVLVPSATGLHGRSLRGTARGRSALIDRLGVRNRFLIAFKYGRNRPGRLGAALVRDVAVVLGVLLRERTSIGGLREAWRLRGHMRAKGDAVLAVARVTSRQACGL